jgi:hypothetical protein
MVNKERDECILHFATFYNRKLICVIVAITSQSSNSGKVNSPFDDRAMDSSFMYFLYISFMNDL